MKKILNSLLILSLGFSLGYLYKSFQMPKEESSRPKQKKGGVSFFNQKNSDDREPISPNHQFRFNSPPKNQDQTTRSMEEDLEESFRKLEDMSQKMRDIFGGFLNEEALDDVNAVGSQILKNLQIQTSLKVNQVDTGKTYEYHLISQHLDESSLKVSIEDSILTISGQVEEVNNQGSSQFKSLSSFTRTFVIPDNVIPGSMDIASDNDKIRIIFNKQ